MHTCVTKCAWNVGYICHWGLWFVDTVLWLCPSLSTETLKWLSSLPILMQESFWWWQCSNRYIISHFPHLHTPFSLSLISLAVSVDVKHHVYLLNPFLRMYFWWSLCTLYLHACQVRVTIGDSGLCCCTCFVFQALTNSLVCWRAKQQVNGDKLNVDYLSAIGCGVLLCCFCVWILF